MGSSKSIISRLDCRFGSAVRDGPIETWEVKRPPTVERHPSFTKLTRFLNYGSQGSSRYIHVKQLRYNVFFSSNFGRWTLSFLCVKY